MKKNTFRKTQIWLGWAMLALCCYARTTMAMPMGGAVLSGTASIETLDATTTVTSSPGAVLSWDEFSIGADETVIFAQPSDDDILLLRVTGNSPSQIAGRLLANGQVIITNPAGIHLAASATAEVKGLVLSTLNLSDQAFAANSLLFLADNGQGTISMDQGWAGDGSLYSGTIPSGTGGAVQDESMAFGPLSGQGAISGELFSVATSKGVTTIGQSQEQSMYTWQSIPADWGKSLNFEQPGPSSVFLNYLPTEDPAQVFTSLTGNGKAFLVTPHGVLFGNTASLGKTDLDALCAAAFASTKSTSCGSDQAATASLGLSTDMLVAGGWNLLGNSTDAPLDVAESFGDAALITSVWKRVPQTNTWAFYSPLPADGGAAYAAKHGYELLTTINGGEGFWVNAKAPFVFALPLGKLRTTAAAQTAMTPGWNMIALGEVKTPSEFNTLLNQSQAGVAMTTLWAWDSAQSNWYFYMASMETDGTLADYIAGKHYLDFTAANKALGPGVGFWVNTKP